MNNISKMHQPIPKLKKVNWDKIKNIELTDNGEKLVRASLIPEKILVRPQYHVEGIAGALPECYVREQVLDKLITASDFLPERYRLVIFAAWRPLQVQKNLYEAYYQKLQEETEIENKERLREMTSRYVAPPSAEENFPSPHNTGGAVDISLVNERGKLLEMGTDFDTTAEESHTRYYEKLKEERGEISEAQKIYLKNRRLLFNAMEAAGFTNYTKEWWHFDYGNQNWAYFKDDDFAAFYGKTQPDLKWLKF